MNFHQTEPCELCFHAHDNKLGVCNHPGVPGHKGEYEEDEEDKRFG